MNSPKTALLAAVSLLLISIMAYAESPYPGWRHTGSLFMLTTPEGANLPASASEEGFPLLVRLNRDFFDFSQAGAHGEDIRFSSAAGAPLPYQIEVWDPIAGKAALWVRIPLLRGNARQEIRMHWGRADAVSESRGSAVFNESNGFLSVWHLNDGVQDEVGTLTSLDRGTTPSAGIIGRGRHFAGDQGLFCGDKIPDYPAGGSPHSTEAWFRAERPNATLIGWGNEGGGRGSKVRMQFRSPPHLHIDSDFSDVNGESVLPMSEWIHVAHTYEHGVGRIYINGRLDGLERPTLNIKSPARMWIGGWYDHYDFIGDMEEVRISRTARSADWIRLEYENQRPQQTLVGPLAQSGSDFSVSPSQLTIPEGGSGVFSANAGGAQKLYWTLKKDGKETVVAVDLYHFTFDAGRVAGDRAATLQFKAVYADRVRTKDIPITIKENIPEPIFTLNAPVQWDGRKTVEVTPTLGNLPQMQAKGVGNLHYAWSVAGLAVIKETPAGRLVLRRAQNSGRLQVTLAIDNGGVKTVHTAVIQVREPRRDAWVKRLPAREEKPEDNQFYARDDNGAGVLIYNGNLEEERYDGKLITVADSAFLKVYAGERQVETRRQRLRADRSYSLSVRLRPGLIRYRVEFGIVRGGQETTLRKVNNLVCGDAYLIDGQSNAEATAWGDEEFPYTSDWIRSFGSPEGSPDGARLKLWGNAVARSPGGRLQIGYWGMELARRLVEDQQMPICILNGAVGGTRIDQHQRNPANAVDVTTIYGRLLWRVRAARLTHGIRAILWHQGENDQGADGPTGGYGWETYQRYFEEMSADWKQDYPNLQYYYVFQIWPRSCSMGINGSDNRLREVQRRLSSLYSHLSVMSTLGIKPPGSCHFPPAGYAEFARLLYPLVERDNYGKTFPHSITAPDLKSLYYAGEKREEITLEFDQPVIWKKALCSQFYLDGQSGRVVSGRATGRTLTLQLAKGTIARNLTYLDSKAWSDSNLLYGENGIAALTFCEVPIRADNPPAWNRRQARENPFPSPAEPVPAR